MSSLAAAQWRPTGAHGAEVGQSGRGGRPHGSPSPAWLRHTRSATAFGSNASLIVLHEDADIASRALDLAVAELRRVESVLSLYYPESALCRLNRDGVLDHPHSFLIDVMRKGVILSEQSFGAFDVTVQPLWELYAAAKRNGRVPDTEEVEAARRKVNWRNIEIAPDRIRLRQPGTSVTLNALAQGYAADRVLATLRGQGVRHALVNAGEIGALGVKEGGEPWTLGIQHPRKKEAYAAIAKLSDCCMSTSGDYATTFSDDYLRHHVFDPATGSSPNELASVTVVAPSGLDADGLSTAVMVLGQERGLKLLQWYSGAEAFLIRKDGETIMTSGFPKV